VLQTPEVAVLDNHRVLLSLHGGAPETMPNDHFNPFRVGLDHFAIGAPSIESLTQLHAALERAGVRNNGIESDVVMAAKYMVFYDPDGIALELYATAN
jgi:glyoxylase I family protein